MELQDKIAVVTGAGRGMGRSISLQLADAGAHVAVADINAENVEETSVAVKAMGRECLPIHADMGNLGDIDRMISQAKDAFGRIDIIVNNAGVTRHIYIMDVEEGDWDRIHRVNAKGVFFGMQRAAREMIEQGEGGRIINIASIAGKGYSGTSNAAYAASKGAVLAMTMVAAHQLGEHNINVNAICPGSTLTEMAAETMQGRAESSGMSIAELEQARDARIPIGRPNTPEDIAAMARFLSGPGARNITGQAFNVDGGLVMH
jgi:NAD(P)-dependent dehydrogenase (short-subunit alcohol dehydrogenase family)